MRVSDAVAGGLFLVFGILVIAMALQLPDMPGQRYGAATFPLLIGGGFVLVSVALIAKGIAEWSDLRGIVAIDWGRSPRSLLRIGVTLLLVVLYIAFSDLLGFTLSSFLVLLVLFLVLQVRPLTAVVIAVVATLAIQQSFGAILRVPLPRSELFGFLW